MLNQISELYLSLGESLENNGIEGFALPISKANLILKICEANRILVLGGDIYIKKPHGDFDYFYADWFYEGNSIEESTLKAHNYLEQFEREDLYVSFTLK